MNIDETKVMRSGKGSGDIVKTGNLPCAACGKGVMSNSIQCTEYCEWVHRRCSDTKVPFIKVQGFRCRMCLTGRDNKDRIKDLALQNGEVIEGVGQFCYLGDVLNGEGGSSMASINRVRSGWKKFRELSGVLTNKVALRLKGRVYAACVRSAMLYGSETWAANTEQVARLSRAEMRMVRCMCGVSLRERKTNKTKNDMGKGS